MSDSRLCHRTMNKTVVHLEGTNGETLCYREEYIDFYGSQKVVSVELQKALELAVKYGSTKIEIEVEVRTSGETAK